MTVMRNGRILVDRPTIYSSLFLRCMLVLSIFSVCFVICSSCLETKDYGVRGSMLSKLDVGFPKSWYAAGFCNLNCGNKDKVTWDVIMVDSTRGNVSIYTWNHALSQFRASGINIAVNDEFYIVNIVPSDYDGDFHVDLLVTCMKRSIIGLNPGKVYHHFIYFGNNKGFGNVLQLPSTHDEVTLVDYYGSMKNCLLVVPVDGIYKDKISVVKTTEDRKVMVETVNSRSGLVCSKFANPHSNSVLDLNGDCLPDIFLTCIATKKISEDRFRVFAGDIYYEMWINSKNGYKLGKRAAFPFKLNRMSLIAFQDINGTGSMDMIFYTDDHLHIFYNTQRPYCDSKRIYEGNSDCKSNSNLCEEDPFYGFDFTLSGKHHTAIPWNTILPKGLSVVKRDPLGNPIPLRFGDFDLDGYPDLLLIVSDSTLKKWSHRSRAMILNNVICETCKGDLYDRNSVRTFKTNMDVDYVLKRHQAVWSAAFYVLNNQGAFGCLLNTYENEKSEVVFLLNSYYRDAFFLQVAMLESGYDGKDIRNPYGINYPGASYKYSFVDFHGYRRVLSSSQYTQTSRMALMTPGIFVGLGRMNTFIEKLSAGIGSRNHVSTCQWTNIIPNSNLYIFPQNSEDGYWKIELHINPSDYTVWILLSLVVAIVILVLIVWFFIRLEQIEDDKEKKRILHAINFDAL